MDEPITAQGAVIAHVPRHVKDKLRDLAQKNNRSLTKHAAWVLERYVQSQEDDGA